MSFCFHMTILLLLQIFLFLFIVNTQTQNVCTLCALIKVRGFVVLFSLYFFLFCITHKKMFCVLQFFVFFLWLLLCYCFGCLRATYGNVCNMVINTLTLLYSLQTVDRTVCAMCVLLSLSRLLIYFRCGNFIQFKFKPITVWMLLVCNTLILTSMKQNTHRHRTHFGQQWCAKQRIFNIFSDWY